MIPAPTLAVHTGGIGDFLLACPALKALAANGGPLTLAGHADRLALAVADGFAERAVDLDAMGFDSLFAEPSETLRAFLAPFERAVIWMRDDDGAIARGLAECGVEEAQIFPGLPGADWGGHAADYYAACLGLPPQPPLRLDIPPEGPPLDVVIHPGSGSAKKNWPLERFHALADQLRTAGREVAWVLGPAESGAAAPAFATVIKEPSLTALAARLAGARCYAGNDSGVTHLAAAAGCPVAAVFGPTSERVWAPRGDWTRAVRGEPWPDAEDVLGALRRLADI